MLPGETLHSMLPWDLPWWLPDHLIFFGVFYAVLGILGLTLGVVFVKTLLESMKGENKKHITKRRFQS